MSNWNDYKKELLSNPQTRQEYDALGPEYAIVSQLLQARNSLGLTQAEIAKRMGVKQSFVARLENGAANPTVSTLKRFSSAIGKKLVIQIQ
jgi:predicted transcriptional regulator